MRFASRHPKELQSLVAKLGKRASAGTPAEAAAFGEIVMITVPLVALLVRDAGFDPVAAGALARGKEFEPGTPIYNSGMSGPQLRKSLA